MAAFAPHTSGIPLGKEKDLEVIKQFYDVSSLIDNITIFEDEKKTYFAVSEKELKYKGVEASSEQALEDTIDAAVCIGARGKTNKDEFPYYLIGTRDIVNHIFERGFSMGKVSSMAPKVIYIASCLLTNASFANKMDIDSLRKENLTQKDLLTMKALRKVRDDSYGYLVLADRLIKEYRQV